MTLYEQFVQFINEQDDDKFIPQRSGWGVCAVGQFASFLGKKTEEEIEDVSNQLYMECGTALSPESNPDIELPRTVDNKPSIMDFLNGRGYMLYLIDGYWDTRYFIESSIANTFGELKQFVNGTKPYYMEKCNDL
jgi:hypothetical protein